MQSLLLTLTLAALVCGFYSPSSDVVILDAKNFKSEVMKSDELWMVEFYAPWCGHCKNLKPHWEKVAKALKGVVKVAAVDCDEHKSVAS